MAGTFLFSKTFRLAQGPALPPMKWEPVEDGDDGKKGVALSVFTLWVDTVLLSASSEHLAIA